MAETLNMTASVEVLLRKIISVTTENINLVFGSPQESSSLMKNLFSHSSEETNLVQAIREELKKLKGSLSNIRAVSQDNLMLQDKAGLWLQKLADLAYDADETLAEFGYEILQHEVEILNQEKQKVRLFSSHSDKKAFRQEMMPKAREINNKLEMINQEVKYFSVTTASPPQGDVLLEVGFSISNLKMTGNEVNLSAENCWFIIKEKAGPSGETATGLEGIGRQIAEKCQGLSLAASLLGGLLRNKGRDFWLSILQSGILDKENMVSQILKLCFDNLQSPFLKRCFAFCSMFPSNSVIERDQLVQLWMAEGFIDPELANSLVEEVGNQYFETLLQNSLLEIVSTDKFNKVTHCKMHSLVHNFASSLSRFDSIVLGEAVQDDILQIQHLALESFTEETIKIAKDKTRHLKTLFLKSNLPDYNLLTLNFLYVLNLCDADIVELPACIGELRHLEYLDLSRTKIKSIPESACNLYKLQTLRIVGCKYLEELPKEFKNLLSLRHLHFHCDDACFHMPYEIGRLTHLQTLPIYNVGETKGPRIGELKLLKDLRGKLEIRNLDLVKDKKEAKQADLCGKPNLEELVLSWVSWSREGENNDRNVLEGLEPHPNLKSLSIQHFLGDRFPSWVMKMSVGIDFLGGSSRLNNLVEVKLDTCKRCKEIPTLGLLPLLKYLQLSHLFKVSCIGPSFYDDNGSSSSNSGIQPAKILFPALKSLMIVDMYELVEWKGAEQISTAHEFKVFPSLESLSVINCPLLTTAPGHFPVLRELNIDFVRSSSPLENICTTKLTTLTDLKIDSVAELTCLPDEMLQHNPDLACLHIVKCNKLTHIVPRMSGCCRALQELVISNCDALQELPADLESLRSLEKLSIRFCSSLELLPTLGGLTSLRSLNIFYCDNLISIPSEVLESCRSLQCLQVENCDNLIKFCPNFEQMPNLSSLKICYCRKLNTIPEGLSALSNLADLEIGPLSDSMALEIFESFFTGLQQLSSLHSLHLVGLPHWNSLPEEFQQLTALKKMTLRNFGIDILPDWIEKLSSIKELELFNFENLHSFPSKEIMKGLTNLWKLTIDSSPLLRRKWAEHCGPDCEWSKVSHIQKIITDEDDMTDPVVWKAVCRPQHHICGISQPQDMEKENMKTDKQKKKKKISKKTKKKTQSSSSTI